MPLIDPLDLLRRNIPFIPALQPGGMSPLRMMLINPRRFFQPTEAFDYTKLLKVVLQESVKEYALDLLERNVPNAAAVVSILNQTLPSFLQDADGSFFRFYINPKNMRVSHQKITQETLTGGGWDFDVLGDQLSTYTFSGTSGSFLTENFDLTSVRLSRSFFKFAAMEQFYLYNNNDPLMIILDTTAYIGKIVNMNWTWDADDIYQIKYDLTLRIQPKYTFDIISGAGVTTLFNSTVLKDLVFDPSVQSQLFVTGFGNIDSYEEEAKLFRDRERAVV